MTKTVIGIFDSEQAAERAVNSLRDAGFDKEISILAKDRRGNGEGGENDTGGATMMAGTGSIANGVTTGGVLGGLAGLAAGAGALVIPGLGPLIAAGPIAGLLSGAATGGIAGGLIDWGIPAAEGQRYEEEVRQGKILVSVRASDTKVDQAESMLRQQGAREVKIHGDGQ